MKGKVTKDILLRVGQGVMRIPRNSDKASPQSQHDHTTPTTKPSPRAVKPKKSQNKHT